MHQKTARPIRRPAHAGWDAPSNDPDFASPVSGLGSKIGLDATDKWPGETNREWGRKIAMDPAVVKKIDAIWGALGLGQIK